MGVLLQKNLTNLTDMSKDLQMILTDIPKNLQIISISSIFLYFSPFFSDILRFSLIFSVFLCFSPKFSPYLVFSSYLCSRNSAARIKGGGVIIFIKVLKNDAALPSAMDSRAFIVFFCIRNIALSDYFRNFAAEIKTLRL